MTLGSGGPTGDDEGGEEAGCRDHDGGEPVARWCCSASHEPTNVASSAGAAEETRMLARLRANCHAVAGGMITSEPVSSTPG